MNKLKLSVCILPFILLSSCTTTKYVEVPVKVVLTEYIHNTDSVYIHDSIDTYVLQKGDTVYISKTKFKIREVYKIDTVCKVDSIPVVVKVKEQVEVNKLHTWLKILIYIGGVGIILLLGTTLIKFKVWKLLF